MKASDRPEKLAQSRIRMRRPAMNSHTADAVNPSGRRMSKKEVDYKFQDIVEFSGIRKFIDTPVKRYSVGMMVRLGFSVAAHLEPEILLVDEVLAVGDLDFQKNALIKWKMLERLVEPFFLFHTICKQ